MTLYEKRIRGERVFEYEYFTFTFFEKGDF